MPKSAKKGSSAIPKRQSRGSGDQNNNMNNEPPSSATSSAASASASAAPDTESSQLTSCPEIGPGWTVQTKLRKNSGSKRNPRVDKQFFSPDGKLFRSTKEVERFLEATKKKDTSGGSGSDSGSGSNEDSIAVDPILDSPDVKNIRVKINLTSREIVGVRGDAQQQPVGGEGAPPEPEGKKAGSGTTTAAAAAADENTAMDVDDDDDDKSNNDMDIDSNHLDEDSGAKEEDDSSYTPPTQHDGNNIKGKRDADDDDDDDENASSDDKDNVDTTTSSSKTKKPSYQPPPKVLQNAKLLNSKVKVIEGPHTGKIGTVISRNGCGWLCMQVQAPTTREKEDDEEEDDDKAVIKVRPREVKALVYADGTKGDDVASASSSSDVDADDSADEEKVNEQKAHDVAKRGKEEGEAEPDGEVDVKEKAQVENRGDEARSKAKAGERNNVGTPDLIGAHVRVKDGKHAGLTGKITERLLTEHVKIDSTDHPGWIAVANIKVVKDGPLDEGEGPTGASVDKYMGATVDVFDEKGNELVRRGLVIKVTTGVWFLTDNPDIPSACKAHKFEVIRYADPSTVKVIEDVNGSDLSIKMLDQTEKERDAEEVEVKDGQDKADFTNGGEENDMSKAEEEEDGDKKSAGPEVEDAEVEDPGDEKGLDKGARASLQGSNDDSNDDSKEAQTVDTSNIPLPEVVDSVSGATAPGNEEAKSGYNSKLEEGHTAPKVTLGSVIRVKRGKLAGKTGVVTEIQKIRLLGIDTVTNSKFSPDDVKILELGTKDDTHINEEKIDDEGYVEMYQNYMGAKVRVMKPGDLDGMEGTVTSIKAYGTWYITDNREIESAMPENKLEVLSYAPPDQKNEGDDGMNQDHNADTNEEGQSGDDGQRIEEGADADQAMDMGDGNDVEFEEGNAIEDPEVHCIPESPSTHKNQHISGESLKRCAAAASSNTEDAIEHDGTRESATDKPESKSSTSHNEGHDSIEGEDEDAENDKEDSTSNKDPDNDSKNKLHPLVGATVAVYEGVSRGMTGKITKIEDRGWWTLDNPEVVSKVKSNQCKIIDDGSANIDEIKKWYSNYKGKARRRIPPIVKPGQEESDVGEEEDRTTTEQQFDRLVSNLKMDAREPYDSSMPFKRKIYETDFAGSKPKKLGVIWNRNPGNGEGQSKKRPCYDPNITIPPGAVLLQATTTTEQGKDRLKLQLLPSELRRLPPETKIEIFNRRTGKIMKGDNAIMLSDLQSALVNHAEYEPIVPPGNSSGTSRAGRSGHKVRISRKVTPQTRVRASKVEGRSVLVTGGEYKGRRGKIESCIPGGWYLVRDLFKNDSLDVVINSRNLELILVETSPDQSRTNEGGTTSMIGLRMHIKAAKLRLEGFSEERQRLKSNFNGNNSPSPLIKSDKKTRKAIMKMDNELLKTNKLLGDLQSALENRLKVLTG